MEAAGQETELVRDKRSHEDDWSVMWEQQGRVTLKGNCSEKFLLQNIFGFLVYITNTYVKLSTETVIMQKNNFEQF